VFSSRLREAHQIHEGSMLLDIVGTHGEKELSVCRIACLHNRGTCLPMLTRLCDTVAAGCNVKQSVEKPKQLSGDD
jgi:hypothetical protein